MTLTSYADYAARALIYLASDRRRLVINENISEAHHIARNHLPKVVHHSGMPGFMKTARRRHGGPCLGIAPDNINVGEVVPHTESALDC